MPEEEGKTNPKDTQGHGGRIYLLDISTRFLGIELSGGIHQDMPNVEGLPCEERYLFSQSQRNPSKYPEQEVTNSKDSDGD